MVDLRHGSRTAAKRLGAGGPSPGGGDTSWPGRKAFGLRRDGGVLAWELGKTCGCGQINHFLRLKNNICHDAELSISAQVWQIKAHGFDLKDPICFHFQTLNTRLQQTTKIITFHHLPSLLTVNRIYSQSITPCREGPGGGRKTHLQVESLLPRLSTDFSVIRSNRFEGFGFSGVWSQEYQDWFDMFYSGANAWRCLESVGRSFTM